MKKYYFIKALSLVLAVILISMSFSSCAAVKVKDSGFYSDYSYIDKLSFKDKNGENTKSFDGVDGDYFDISLDASTVIDTVVLKEKGDNITDFEIFVKQNGEFVSIYKQDLVGSFRYCAFSDVNTNEIRVQVHKTSSGSFTLSSIDVLNSQHDSDFKVTSYVVADRVYDINSVEAEHFSVITDVILFGTAVFDETGHITFNSTEIDGKTVSGEDVLKKAMANIRQVSQNKNIRFYINILGPSGENDDEKQELHTECFKNHSTNFIKNINTMLTDYGVDGVFFDYEFPYAAKHMRAFSDFIVLLDKNIESGKKIGAALVPWGKSLSADAKEALDYVEIMAYDLFDSNGYHSTFASQGGAFALDYFNNKGYDMDKCDFGVPFYARPVDADAVWLDYNSAYETLGKFSNVDTSVVDVDDEHKQYSVARYYNSYQMIFDKTAFAYDYGVGGMMVWHYSCDAPTDSGLSLFDAMAKAIESRQN